MAIKRRNIEKAARRAQIACKAFALKVCQWTWEELKRFPLFIIHLHDYYSRWQVLRFLLYIWVLGLVCGLYLASYGS